jgi:beta-glucanase (GH16 family)
MPDLRKSKCRRIDHASLADLGPIRRASRSLACLAVSVVTALALLMTVNVAASTAIPPGTWTQTFDEEFNGSSVNTSMWTKGWQTSSEISGPVSSRCLSSAFVSESEGYLHLEVRKQSSTCGGKEQPETGALVESNPNDGVSGHPGFAYSYGYVEWRVYLPGVEEAGCPAGGCIANWPALWSFPDDNSETPEIDTMEGLEEWVEEGGKSIAHKGRACFHFHPWPEVGTGACSPGYAGWHTFASDWEPNNVTYYYDGNKVGEIATPTGNRSTPQYLIMDDVATYSLEPKLFNHAMLVDYVRVWQHLPIVTTDAATGKQPLQATLNGAVNSNGTTLSNCHFEYGTSTSYGSSAPCSGSESNESATVSLAPGTTYHFRIAATNASGPAYGNDETFKTPGPVEAVTDAATNVEEEQATLNGTVDPREYDAKYYFQYGPSTSYTSSTPEGDAGEGVNPESEKATIIGLQPGTTYHYRLVASSGGVTSYGHDQTFRTRAQVAAFYQGSNGVLSETYYAGEKWASREFGALMAAGTSPSVVIPEPGQVGVFYQGSNKALWETYYASGKWTTREFGALMAAGTSPSVVIPEPGQVGVFYQGSTGVLSETYYAYEEWASREFGALMAAGTSPSVVAT